MVERVKVGQATVGQGTAKQGQTYTVVTAGSHRVVQVRRVRPDGWTKARRVKFLAALSTTCNVTSSSAAVGMNRSSASALRRRDPLFAAQWADALASGYDRLEEGLLAAAIAGLSEATALDVGLRDGVGDGVSGGVGGGVGTLGSDDGAQTVDEFGTDESVGTATGVVRLASMQAVQVALALLARHAAEVRGYAGANSRARKLRRRATQAETDASIAKKLDSLARRLRASTQGGT